MISQTQRKTPIFFFSLYSIVLISLPLEATFLVQHFSPSPVKNVSHYLPETVKDISMQEQNRNYFTLVSLCL